MITNERFPSNILGRIKGFANIGVNLLRVYHATEAVQAVKDTLCGW